MSAIVELDDVVKEYPLGKLVVKAVQGVSLTIDRGEFCAIAGPSGSGKTTILNMIGCVDVPTSGRVTVANHITNDLSDKELTELRLHKLGFIFQTFNLIAVLDVFQNVEFPLLLKGGMTRGERRKAVERIVEGVGITEQMHQRPNELSGGQRQRVAIARALVTNPAIVLADEPTANLDTATGHDIIDLMKEMNRENETTFIFSTHDPKVMDQAERIILLEDGKVADDGRSGKSQAIISSSRVRRPEPEELAAAKAEAASGEEAPDEETPDEEAPDEEAPNEETPDEEESGEKQA